MTDKKYEKKSVWWLWVLWTGSFVWPGRQEYLTIGSVIEDKTAFKKRLRR